MRGFGDLHLRVRTLPCPHLRVSTSSDSASGVPHLPPRVPSPKDTSRIDIWRHWFLSQIKKYGAGTHMFPAREF